MPWSGPAGSQTYSRTNGVHSGTTQWAQDSAAGIGVRADYHDTADQDIATALNLCLKQDGGTSLIANIPAAGFGFTALGVLSSAAEVAIASGATTNVLGAAALFVDITGTTTITSLGTGANTLKIVRFVGALTLTYNATSLILPGAANITTAAGDMMLVTSDGSSNARVISYLRASTTPAGAPNSGLQGQLFGLTLANDGASPNTVIDIAAGSCRDSTDVDTLVLGTFTKTTGAWAVGTGNGGLDTGAVGNSTWYHVWVIKRVDTGVVDVLISLSATAPTMPANYTLKRRIGSFLTDGSAHIIAFKQLGDEFLWKVPTQDANNATWSSTATLVACTVPTGIQVGAIVMVEFSFAGGLNALVTSPDQTDSAATNWNMITTASSTIATFNDIIRTDTSGNLRVRATGSTGATGNVWTRGWMDYRGRLS